MTSCRPIATRFVAALLSLTPAVQDGWAAETAPRTESAANERVTQFIVKVKASATPQSTHPNAGEEDAHAALARRAVERVLQESEAPAAGRTRRSTQRIVETRPMSGAAHVVTLSAPVRGETASAIAARLQAQPEIEYAEPDYRLYRQLMPSDPLYEKQWGFGRGRCRPLRHGMGHDDRFERSRHRGRRYGLSTASRPHRTSAARLRLPDRSRHCERW